MSIILREGFWRSSKEPNLPMPVESEQRWLGQDAFLLALALVESDQSTRGAVYRRYRRCLCCGHNTGCKTRELSWGRGFEWHWPEGFRHYVAMHNVRPSLAFEEFILYVAEAIKKACQDEKRRFVVSP